MVLRVPPRRPKFEFLFAYIGIARKRELRDTVEGMQAQIAQLTEKGQVLEKRTKEAEVRYHPPDCVFWVRLIGALVSIVVGSAGSCASLAL